MPISKINKTVYDYAQELARKGGRRMTIVSSGHVSDNLDDQIYELNKVAESGTDALILITNRLAKPDESDDVFLENLEYEALHLPFPSSRWKSYYNIRHLQMLYEAIIKNKEIEQYKEEIEIIKNYLWKHKAL